MRRARIFYRSIHLLFIILAGCLLTVFLQRGTMLRHGMSSRITCWWHRRVLAALGIRLRVTGQALDTHCLYLANHLSWLDIHVIGSQLPVRFLSKAEVRQWPIFGWLASRAGTLYIPRGSKHAAARASHIMQQALTTGQSVVLFPESTTSDGNIKRFHSRLMQSAIDANCPVQALALRYPNTDGGPVHDAVLYIGDIHFMQSVNNILRADAIVAELNFLDSVPSQNNNRDQLARWAETSIRAVLEPNTTGSRTD